MMTIGTTSMLSVAAVARGSTPEEFTAALATQRAMVAAVLQAVGPLRAP